MAIPLPSFFKIRLSIVIIILFVFIFLVGVAKQVFAEVGHITSSGDCYAYYIKLLGTGLSAGNQLIKITGQHELPYDYYQLDNDYVGTGSVRITWYRYKWIDGAWVNQSGGSYYTTTSRYPPINAQVELYGGSDDVTPHTYAPNGCEYVEPCLEEKAALESECGEGNYTINEETCVGYCKCADEDEDGVCNACDLDPLDPEINNKAWIWHRVIEPDGTLCEVDFVYKKSDCSDLENADIYSIIPTTPCSESAVHRAQFPCLLWPVRDNCTPDNCNVCDNNDGDLNFPVSGIPTPQDNDPQPDTPEKKDQCQERCFPKSFMYVPGTDDCICVDYYPVGNDPNPDDGTSKPTDSPDTPDTDAPQNAPDPGAGDSDLLDSIEQNTRSGVKNSAEIASQIAKGNQTLEWIGDNAKTTADNTAKIENSIDGLASILGNLGNNNTGLENDIDDLGDSISTDLDDLQDAIEGETGPIENLDYTVPEEYTVDEHDFGTRTSQFLDEMKTTGLFSVPTQFFGNIPSGGTGDFIIDGGETYGTHTLSFSNFSTGLLALRTVIQLAFMWLAIRIVTLKR